MSDLIRRSDLLRILESNEPMNWHDTDEDITEKACWHWFNKVVENAPAVDAVSVVRCCDCKHSKCEQDVAWCNISWGLMGCLDLDDFCCHGKRRENNEID